MLPSIKFLLLLFATTDICSYSNTLILVLITFNFFYFVIFAAKYFPNIKKYIKSWLKLFAISNTLHKTALNNLMKKKNELNKISEALK